MADDAAYVDHFIGQLFDCAHSELSRDTVFVATSDQAEPFGECGWLGHHVAPATDVFDVPLVVYGLPEIDHQADGIVYVDITRTLVAYPRWPLVTVRRYHVDGQASLPLVACRVDNADEIFGVYYRPWPAGSLRISDWLRYSR